MDLEIIKNKFSKIKELHGWHTEDPMKNYLSSIGIDVVSTGCRNLGRCYNASYYMVSSSEEISDDLIHLLKDNSLLGYGQEFSYTDPIQVDGKWVVNVTATVDSSD